MECQAAPARAAGLKARAAAWVCASLACLAASPGAAHPHMWIDAKAEVVFDDAGRLSAVRQTWLFDEMFSAYGLQGVPRAPGGGFAPATLQAMADDWMKALGDPQSHYFTRVTHGGRGLDFGTPRRASVAWDEEDQRLSLAFELPLAQPAALAGAAAQLDIFDPTYFVAYEFAGVAEVTMAGAPEGCRRTYRPPRPMDVETMQQLAAIPADVAEPPEELFAITKGLSHRIEVSCP